MKRQVNPSEIDGTVEVPPSKSYMQRAIATAIVAKGVTEISNPSFCKDSVSSLSMAEALGVEIEKKDNKIFIKGGFPHCLKYDTRIDAGESGLGIRLFTPIAALGNSRVEITASGSLLKRPVDMLKSPLEMLGATFSSRKGYPPVKVKGPIRGGSLRLEGSISSQFITGIITALSSLPSNSVLKVDNIVSAPYLDMTLQVLKSFGGKIENPEEGLYKIEGVENLMGCKYEVEGDWSCGAVALTAGAIGGSAKVEGISLNSLQPDSMIIEALELAGAKVEAHDNYVEVSRKKLKAFTFDATHCPDLFPPLVALAANCRGITRLHGANRLIHKESNRKLALKDVFKSLGVELKLSGNTIVLEGGKIDGGKVESFNDHRIAMAATLGAVNSLKPVTITGSEAVEKSWPDFFKDFSSIGGKVDE